MSTHRYVLINRNGKHADRSDKSILALKMHAKREREAGRGGGLVDLLQPRDIAEYEKIMASEKLYTVKNVKCRSNAMRKKARDTVLLDDALIATIAVLYEKRFGHIPGAIQTKKIAAWIATELQDVRSPVYKTIERKSAVLDQRQRPGWWEKRFAERRKHMKTEKYRKTAS